jgi:hypothetical protein
MDGPNAAHNQYLIQRKEKKITNPNQKKNYVICFSRISVPYPQHLIAYQVVIGYHHYIISSLLLFCCCCSHLFGEKHRAVIMSLWSSVCKCLPSLRSHNIALQSLPPLAQRLPSGDTVTVFKYPVCPEWLILRRQLVRFHTLTMRSQPAETMMGFE